MAREASARAGADSVQWQITLLPARGRTLAQVLLIHTLAFLRLVITGVVATNAPLSIGTDVRPLNRVHFEKVIVVGYRILPEVINYGFFPPFGHIKQNHVLNPDSIL